MIPVAEQARLQQDALIAQQLALIIGERGGSDLQCAGSTHAATGIVEHVACEDEVAAGADAATCGVADAVQAREAEIGRCRLPGARDDGAALVLQHPGTSCSALDADAAPAADGTLLIVDAAGQQIQGAFAGDFASAVVECVADAESCDAAPALNQMAARVVKRAGAELQGFIGRRADGLDVAAAVAEHLLRLDGDIATVAADMPLVVGKRLARQMHVCFRDQRPAPIVDLPGAAAEQCTSRTDSAPGVVYIERLQVQAVHAVEHAAPVAELIELAVQCPHIEAAPTVVEPPLRAELAHLNAGAVGQRLAGVEIGLPIGNDLPAGIVDLTGHCDPACCQNVGRGCDNGGLASVACRAGDVHDCPGADAGFSISDGRDRYRADGSRLSVERAVVQDLGTDAKILDTGLADLAQGIGHAVCIDVQPRRRQLALAVVQTVGLHLQFPRSAHGPAVADSTGIDPMHVVLAGYGATVVQPAAPGIDAYILPCATGCDGAAVGQQPIGREQNLTGAGADGTGIAHSQPGFGTNQGDLARIHAAKLADVERELRSGCIGDRLRRMRLDVITAVLCRRPGDGVLPRDDSHMVAPDTGVDLCGTRQDAGVVGQAGIQPPAIDGDGSALHPIAIQTAALAELGHPGGKESTAGIDEPATVHMNARRVGNDELGLLPGNFKVAIDLTGIGAVDFVEDDFGSPRGQPRVPLNPAALLTLYIAAAVVENGALLLDIELAVGVAADSGSTRRLDIDNWHPIGRLQDGWPLAAWRPWISHYLCMGQLSQQRIERQIETQDPQHQSVHCMAGAATGSGCIARILAMRPGGFRHRHVLPTDFAEDNPVTLLIHDASILKIARKAGHRRRGCVQNAQFRLKPPVTASALKPAGLYRGVPRKTS